MYLHKEQHTVRPRKKLWFLPVTAELHVYFGAPPALSACSHPGPSSAKYSSCVTPPASEQFH